jgi:hypothetical protein
MKKTVDEIDLTPDLLAQWRLMFQPRGSGPLSMMRKIVRLVEALAEARGWDLDSQTFEWADSLWVGMDRMDHVPPERALFEIQEKYGGFGEFSLDPSQTRLVLAEPPVFANENERSRFNHHFPEKFMGYRVEVAPRADDRMPFLGEGI